MKRFRDKNLTLEHFENEVFVQCPKCQLRALITKEESEAGSVRTLKCPNCFFSQTGRKKYYLVELNCPCSNCGADIKLKLPYVNEMKKSMSVKCPSCGVTRDYEPDNTIIEKYFKYKGQPMDPYFHLPLWLTGNVKGNTLWAYNYEHLNYIKEYISADIRESDGKVQWTLLRELPEWVKSSKNRSAVLKAIGRLEKK